MHVISKSWHDLDPSASIGVGLSRSGDPRAPLWAMAVTFPSNEPTVKGSIKADLLGQPVTLFLRSAASNDLAALDL